MQSWEDGAKNWNMRINSVIFLSNNKNNDNSIEYFLTDKLWSSLLLDFFSCFITFYLPWLPGTFLCTSLNPIFDADSHLFEEKKMKQHYGIIYLIIHLVGVH